MTQNPIFSNLTTEVSLASPTPSQPKLQCDFSFFCGVYNQQVEAVLFNQRRLSLSVVPFVVFTSTHLHTYSLKGRYHLSLIHQKVATSFHLSLPICTSLYNLRALKLTKKKSNSVHMQLESSVSSIELVMYPNGAQVRTPD